MKLQVFIVLIVLALVGLGYGMVTYSTKSNQEARTRPPRPIIVDESRTTVNPPPAQCTSASTANLTEYWRNNFQAKTASYESSDFNYLDNGRVWFRFTGEAGLRLRDTCPYIYSCGSNGALWSDDQMPKIPGETRRFKIYLSQEDYKYYNMEFCKIWSFQATVTRCSSSYGDLVYRIDDGFNRNYHQFQTVCGMF